MGCLSFFVYVFLWYLLNVYIVPEIWISLNPGVPYGLGKDYPEGVFPLELAMGISMIVSFLFFSILWSRSLTNNSYRRSRAYESDFEEEQKRRKEEQKRHQADALSATFISPLY